MGKLYPPVAVGEKKTCPECQNKDIEIEVHAVETMYQGNPRLSWKNPNGTSHIKRENDGTFVHNPIHGNPEESSAIEATEEVKKRVEQLRAEGHMDAFAIEYVARKMIFSDYVSLHEQSRGAILGNMTTNSFGTFPTVQPVEFKKASKLTAERVKTPAQVGLGGQTETLEDNVRKVISGNPDFFSNKTSINQNIEIYLREIYGIELPDIPISLESISRAFRDVLSPDKKHYDKEEEYREKYSWATGENGVGSGTVDKRLLL